MRQRQKAESAQIAEKEPGLDLSSLIDVSFLLLIYFLVTSTLNIPDADLDLTVRDGNGDQIAVIEKPTIEIDSTGQIFFTEELIETDVNSRELPSLKDRLAMYVKVWKIAPNGKAPGVIVSADNSSKGQRFVDVLNCLAEVGISDVAMTMARDNE